MSLFKKTHSNLMNKFKEYSKVEDFVLGGYFGDSLKEGNIGKALSLADTENKEKLVDFLKQTNSKCNLDGWNLVCVKKKR